MSQRHRLDYAYAVGRIKALEKYLVSQKLFLEALEAHDLEASLKVIYEAGLWPEEIIKARRPEDIDNLSKREVEKLNQLMAELLEAEVFYFFQAEPNLHELWLKAQRTGYPFFIEYSRCRLDLANIKIFLRLKYREESADKLEKALFTGGFIEPRIFIRAFDQPWSDLYSLLMKTDYGILWQRSLLALEEQKTLAIMERESESFLIHFWRRAREITFGPEPVLAYAMAKLREIKLMRLVIIGRMLNLPPELIKVRLSETYV